VNVASQNRPLWLALAGIPVLIGLLFVLQRRIDASTRSEAQAQEALLLRSPSTIKRLSLGYNSLLADIYWTRVVQYYGNRMATPHATFGLLWPLLDITTTLDPKLLPAYHFGAIFLSQPASGLGGVGRPDLAVKLVKRGIAANPDRWGLYGDLGFLYYWYLQDYHRAAAAYMAGSQTPQGPSWMKVMAARMDQKGGSIETSRLVWSQIYESSENQSIRKLALDTLRGLKAEEDEAALNNLADQYRQRFGRYPASMTQLRDAGFLRGIPLDPEGYPYVLGPDGKVGLDPHSPVTIPQGPRTPPHSPTN
jgi:hypothetical protein